MTALLDAALQYAELGYPVFPCADALEPAPLTRHGFRDGSTDLEKITRWWEQFPTACIGLATTGLLVVDVDGPANPWLTEDRALELSRAPTARTRRGSGDCRKVLKLMGPIANAIILDILSRLREYGRQITNWKRIRTRIVGQRVTDLPMDVWPCGGFQPRSGDPNKAQGGALRSPG